jgi:hypothetical protein
MEKPKSFKYLRSSARIQRMEELEQQELVVTVEGGAAGDEGA